MVDGLPDFGVVLALIVGLLASVTIMFFVFREGLKDSGPRR